MPNHIEHRQDWLKALTKSSKIYKNGLDHIIQLFQESKCMDNKNGKERYKIINSKETNLEDIDSELENEIIYLKHLKIVNQKMKQKVKVIYCALELSKQSESKLDYRANEKFDWKTLKSTLESI